MGQDGGVGALGVGYQRGHDVSDGQSGLVSMMRDGVPDRGVPVMGQGSRQGMGYQAHVGVPNLG